MWLVIFIDTRKAKGSTRYPNEKVEIKLLPFERKRIRR